METLYTKSLEDMLHDDLTNPEFVAGYLQTALEENGIEGFLVALRQVVKFTPLPVASSEDVLEA